MQRLTGDARSDAYLVRLAERARQILGRNLIGSYLVNSGARDDYLPGRSDLDVALIVSTPLTAATKRGLADALRHGSLPCPAPRLELVVYPTEVARDPGPRPRFELNLNSGPAIADRVTLDPAEEPWFWFALDLGAAADAARAIVGPTAATIFGAVPRRTILEALLSSDAWHRTDDARAPNRVLNACRAWCWLVTSRWRSKTAAAAWAIGAGGDAGLIRHALAIRAGRRHDPLPAEGVDRQAEAVRGMIEDAAAGEPSSA